MSNIATATVCSWIPYFFSSAIPTPYIKFIFLHTVQFTFYTAALYSSISMSYPCMRYGRSSYPKHGPVLATT